MNERHDPEHDKEIAKDAQIREIMEKYGLSYEDAKIKRLDIFKEAEKFGPRDEKEEED